MASRCLGATILIRISRAHGRWYCAGVGLALVSCATGTLSLGMRCIEQVCNQADRLFSLTPVGERMPCPASSTASALARHADLCMTEAPYVAQEGEATPEFMSYSLVLDMNDAERQHELSRGKARLCEVCQRCLVS